MRFFALIAALVLFAGGDEVARAENYSWVGVTTSQGFFPSGQWPDGSHWSPNPHAGGVYTSPTGADDASIALVAGIPYIVDVTTGSAVSGLSVGNADATLRVNVNGYLTVNGAFSLTAGTVVDGSGSLSGMTLSGSGTTAAGTTLQVSRLTVNSTLTVNGSLVFTSSGGLSTGSGTVTANGP